MKIIREEKLNRQIKEDFSYPFIVEEKGFYLIEISARARSEKQIGPEEKDDDDLRIEIDDKKFSQLTNPQRYFDSPAAFSGGKLHNLKKTVFFLIHFFEGEHSILFIPDREPKAEEFSIKFVGDDISNVSLALNNKAEDGDRRPWITFVLADLPLKSLKATISAKWRFFDGDDVKLIINDKIQKNPKSIFHKNWLWASSIIHTLLGKTEQAEEFALNLPQETHYLEFWADRMPTLNDIEFDFGEDFDELIQQNLRQYKSYNNEDYNRYDKEIKQTVKFWNEEFKKQQYPPPEPLNPNLVKAMVYIESRMGYMEGGYPDVMQVADPDNPVRRSMLKGKGYEANEFISENAYGHMSYNYQIGREPTGHRIEDSIFWGVRWLYHKAQYLPQILEKPYRREWRTWNKAVRLYNGGGDTEYEKKVYDVYERGVDNRNKENPVKLWPLLMVVVMGLWGWSMYSNQGKIWLSFAPTDNSYIEYMTSANIVDGFRVQSVEIAGNNIWGGNMYSARKDNNPRIYSCNLFGNEDREFIVETADGFPYISWRVLENSEGGLRIVPNVSQHSSEQNIFIANGFDLIDIDSDGIFEIRELSHIGYDNAPDQIWYSLYSYNSAKGRYEFFKQDKIEYEEHSRETKNLLRSIGNCDIVQQQ